MSSSSSPTTPTSPRAIVLSDYEFQNYRISLPMDKEYHTHQFIESRNHEDKIQGRNKRRIEYLNLYDYFNYRRVGSGTPPPPPPSPAPSSPCLSLASTCYGLNSFSV